MTKTAEFIQHKDIKASYTIGCFFRAIERSDAEVIEVSRHDSGINIKGHAHYAEPGKDIVCAGVSTLVGNLIQSIEELTTDQIEYSMQPGDCKIIFKSLSDDSMLFVSSFWLGIKAIAETYPENVCILLTNQ